MYETVSYVILLQPFVILTNTCKSITFHVRMYKPYFTCADCTSVLLETKAAWSTFFLIICLLLLKNRLLNTIPFSRKLQLRLMIAYPWPLSNHVTFKCQGFFSQFTSCICLAINLDLQSVFVFPGFRLIRKPLKCRC